MDRTSELDNPYPWTFKPFLNVFESINLALPPQMVKEIAEDSEHDLGNKEVVQVINPGIYDRIEGDLLVYHTYFNRSITLA